MSSYPIHDAIKANDLFQFEEAVKTDDVGQPNEQGITPLELAATQKNEAITKRILKKLFGREIPVHFDKEFYIPIQRQYQKLLSSIKAKTIYPTFLTPRIHKIAFEGDLSTLKETKPELLKQPIGSNNLTPLHYAIAGRKKDSIEFLIKHTDLSKRTKDNSSYLHYAAQTGDREILDLFLNLDIDPTIEDQENFTAAHYWTAISEDLSGLKALEEKGVPLHSENISTLSPALVAMLNAIKSGEEKLTGPLTRNDFYLLAIHLMRFSLYKEATNQSQQACHTTYEMMDALKNFHYANLCRDALGFFKRRIVARMISPEQKLIKTLNSPWLGLVTNLAELVLHTKVTHPAEARPLSAVTTAASAYAILQNTKQSFTRLKNASRLQNIVAIPVHIANSVFALFDIYMRANPYPHFEKTFCHNITREEREDAKERFWAELSFGTIPGDYVLDDSMKYHQNKDHDFFHAFAPGDHLCSEKTQEYEKMDLKERIQKMSDFVSETPHSLKADKMTLNPSLACKDELSLEDCTQFKKNFKEMSLLLHPDKNRNNPDWDPELMNTASAAYEKVKEACKRANMST